MIIRHQFLLFIHILCCAAIHGILLDANDAETCNLLCIKCNTSAVFENGHCECNFVDDSNKECIQQIQKEIQAIELNMLSDDLTDEERKIRSILKYRRRLRPEYASYVSPTMQGVDLSTLGKPPFIYPPTGVYDPTTVPLGTISHPHGLPHALFRAVTFPAHVLHRILHPRVYHHYPLHHRGIIRSTNDKSNPDQTIGQYENNDGSNTSNLPTARSNADKPTEQNVLGLNDPLQYPIAYIADALYQPMQHQNYPYPYNSYYNPLINMFHSIPNEYLLQPMSLYPQNKLSDPWTSASNPQSFCKNNVNTEQKNEVLSADKIKNSNGIEKSDDPTKNNIPNEEKI
ncbi:PREDICTED: uncharacterized protein LOC105151058 isoform X2 [Acromyrmex echinatior]|uniref:uncharacterized protein LOC105151058 isoform X2 n=1 Tax=Acromyrmex echinatior TaxID=103372 RepID=UPI000580E7D0|nr:PREDICTED: uncharacterized protein LOC105151058 isoform X2 [Acromyrmex echinatior]